MSAFPKAICGADDLKGRFLEAERSMEPGRVVLEEMPRAAVLQREFRASHCSYCFTSIDKSSETIQCSACGEETFCSSICKSLARNEYHWLECQHKDLLDQLGPEAVLALRLLLADEPDNIKTSERKRAKIEKFDKWPSDFDLVSSLMTHENRRSEKEIGHYRKVARELVQVTSTSSNESWSSIDKDVLFGFVMRHLLQIQCNVHAITALVVDRREMGDHVETQNQVRLALAIYPRASLLNHSCDPNVIVSYERRKLFVRTLKSVSKGDELLHCYGPHCARMRFRERRKALREQYYFDCVCSACSTEEASERELGHRFVDLFVCGRCNGLLKACDDENVGSCSTCKKSFIMKKKFDNYDAAQKIFDAAEVHKENNDFDRALTKYHQCLKIHKSLLHKSSKTLGRTHDSIAEVYANLGLFKKASEHCQASCVTVELIFGEASMELANELLKLAQLYFNSRQAKEALQMARRGLSIFSRYCDNTDERIIELKEMENFLEQIK
ncbi:SET and MYND domain-containing protein 4-like [Oscarella lobularis]|uniref:SET and MYND domain-containing protein 4-like n=1 Tax=Oscarella lobularis TaxID=121494 RepID=UPI003313B6D8